MRLIVLGPPGAGKTTQAARLARHYSVPHISPDCMGFATGAAETTRRAAARDRLAVDEGVLESVRNQIVRPEAKEGFILDGFPRSAGQAMALSQDLSDAGARPDAVICLKVDEAVLAGRISARARVSPVEDAEIQAAPDEFLIRLQSYRKTIKPLMEFLQNEWQPIFVDGNVITREVFESIIYFVEYNYA